MTETQTALSKHQEIVRALPYNAILDRLHCNIEKWVENSDEEFKTLFEWQFLGPSKYFRPSTVFACHDAIYQAGPSKIVMQSAVALELTHNMSLIIDDILDRSRYRRGKLTLHCRFGYLPALMASGYITAAVFELIENDPFAVHLFAQLIKRLGMAESMQWRLRRQPLGVEDWRIIAGEDTGVMFETCACLGSQDQRLRRYGALLGMLYHGCDDVADIRGAVGLGGGGDEDLRDGILTLPAAIAIKKPNVAMHFRNPTKKGQMILLEAMQGALPKAEEYLDVIAREAGLQASNNSANSKPLLQLIELTRTLSKA